RRRIQGSPRGPRRCIGPASCRPRRRRGSARVAARRHRPAHAALGREETMRVRGLFLLISAVWAASVAAAESCYTVRPPDGQVTYEVSQAGSAFRGEISRFGGEICLEEDRISRIDVWLDPASVNSGLPEID